MFFLFPFSFLIPILFIFVAVRVGTWIFHEFFREFDDPYKKSWLTGSRFGPRFNFGNPRIGKLQGVEARIFRLAYKLKGRITISDIVLETGLDVKSAEETINKMVDGLRVRMEIDENGLVMYEFPEIIARFKGN